MYPRILTEKERKIIKTFLAHDGKKKSHIRMLLYRSKKYLPIIQADMELLKKLQETYKHSH